MDNASHHITSHRTLFYPIVSYLPRGLDVDVALPLVREAELSPLPFLAVRRLPGAVGVLAPAVSDVHHAGELVSRAEPRLSGRPFVRSLCNLCMTSAKQTKNKSARTKGTTGRGRGGGRAREKTSAEKKKTGQTSG